MELIDFSFAKDNEKYYGGSAGSKLGFDWNNEYWFLKFPKNTKSMRTNHDGTNEKVSYTTSPLSEYLGSHIYNILGYPVHQTCLGYKDGKIVVACKDFLDQGDELIEFEKLKNTYISSSYNSSDDYEGNGKKISEVLYILENNITLKKVPGIIERFWDMFIVDSFIGNNDRNNGNWGIIKKSYGGFCLAPIYDNGNSFDNKGTDKKFDRILKSTDALYNSAFQSRICFYKYDDNTSINPLDYIQKMYDHNCSEALVRFVQNMNMNKIYEFIDEIPETYNQQICVMSQTQKEYYKKLLQYRYDEILKPTYEKVCEHIDYAKKRVCR